MDLPYSVRLLSPLLVALTSCMAGTAREVVPVVPPESCLAGTVSAVGTDFDSGTILRLDDGQEIHITGEEESFIRVLSGTVMSVCGEVTRSARAQRTIKTESFELLSVDGMTAYLGTLQQTDSSWQLIRGGNEPLVLLSGVSGLLREAEGTLVWVAGAWTDQSFSVKSFGLMERS